MLDKPIQMFLTTDELGQSLNPIEPYMRNHPMQATRLENKDRARPAIDKFGSFDAWALDLINRSVITNIASDIEEPVTQVSYRKHSESEPIQALLYVFQNYLSSKSILVKKII